MDEQNIEKVDFYTDNYEEKVDAYSKLDIAEIRKLEPKWACGENIDKLSDFSQHPEFGNYKVIFVNVNALVSKTEFFDKFCATLFSNDISSDCRIASTIERWENNLYVDPPTVTLSMNFKDKLSISDGRHRTKLTYHMNVEEMPIAVQEQLIPKVLEILNSK